MATKAWGVQKPAAVVPFAALLHQQEEEKKQSDQELRDRALALSLQEEYGSPSEDPSPPTSTSAPALIDADHLLALKLQREFDGLEAPSSSSSSFPAPSASDEDFALALQLQNEFNSDYNRHLAAHERVKNAGSKVQVSFQHYRVEGYEQDHGSLEEPEEEEHDPFPHPVTGNKQPFARSGGLKKSGKKRSGTATATATAAAQPGVQGHDLPPRREIITKHDIDINSARNARRMEMLPSIEIGNTRKVKDLRLPYRVFNSLKNHAVKEASRQENRGKTRLFDKDDTATQDSVLDRRTRLLLLNMLNQEVLQQVEGILSTGKEANVYYGVALENWEDLEEEEGGKGQDGKKKKPGTKDQEARECAIKIFKTTLQEFRNREEYIRDDSRYHNRLSRHNPRKLIKLWAEKEMLNLNRMRKVGLPCPEVLFYDQHVLVLSFIGQDKRAAPKLKEVGKFLSSAKREGLYRQCIDGMRRLYQEAHLVHADLSEYNLLYHDHALHFIDVSQAVETIHPNARTFLLRDCLNVTRYFRSIGVTTLLSELELFSYVVLPNPSLGGAGDLHLQQQQHQQQLPLEDLAEEVRLFVQDRLGQDAAPVSLDDADILQVLDRLLPSFIHDEALELATHLSSDSAGETEDQEEEDQEAEDDEEEH